MTKEQNYIVIRLNKLHYFSTFEEALNFSRITFGSSGVFERAELISALNRTVELSKKSIDAIEKTNEVELLWGYYRQSCQNFYIYSKMLENLKCG